MTFKRYKNLLSVMITAVLDPAADHHNLVDVVLDALQACGLVVNDRGVDDEIWLFIQPGEEEK